MILGGADFSHRRNTTVFGGDSNGAAEAVRCGASRAAGVAQFRVLRGRSLSSCGDLDEPLCWAHGEVGALRVPQFVKPVGNGS